jgi:hypothetical protein
MAQVKACHSHLRLSSMNVIVFTAPKCWSYTCTRSAACRNAARDVAAKSIEAKRGSSRLIQLARPWVPLRMKGVDNRTKGYGENALQGTDNRT